MVHLSQSEWPAWTYSVATNDDFTQYAQIPDYPFLAESMKAYQAQHNHLVHHQQMSRTTESKPRLSKEEVEVLEAEFQKNHKPNSSTKKALAESMRVDHARINNWFQNRRAREKKENNIREYEARQRAEKERTDVETGLQGSDRKRDLVASSAPFPQPRRASQAKEQSPDAPSQLSTASESSTDAYEATPPVTPHLGSLSSLVFRHADDEQHSSAAEDDSVKTESPSKDYVSASESDMSFANVSALDTMLSIENTADQYANEYQEMDLERITAFLDQTAIPSSPDHQLKSPCPTDIASRRNRQTPQLSINGPRSYSGVLSRAGADVSRRSEQVGSMRRVVSTSGTGRVRKSSASSATPRSPFFQRNRSPMAAGSAAPPTPNTPVVAEPHSINGALFPLTTKYSSSALIQDPTLRTPPTTPAFLENFVFNNNGTSYAMGNFGMRTFPDDLDASIHGTAAEYDAGIKACSSQPTTPMFPYQVGAGYFSGYTGSSDYNWPYSSNTGESSSDFVLPYTSSMGML
ncbi:homeobox [Trichoderma arundinaceum]|uniref:Homeobox n=1 Tax=Trichoderma arundinaceum TaxID=490622 RepID=A0A395NV39_TRIAR|nr:homeobox [Trichoderma arundinaceum]